MMALPKRRTRRHKNALVEHKQLLVDLPLDVLIEVFILLEPLDLLYLARTSKVLRGFLLDRGKASALWKNVISNVDRFPPCPDHMSAPAYTHLAFVPVCHGCYCPCDTIEWEMRMRCCPDCFPKMTIPQHSAHMTTAYQAALRLPTAHTHYKLYDGTRGITVRHEALRAGHSVSRSDWKMARSRKRPRDVSTEEFVYQQNEYWRLITVHADSCRDWEYERLEKEAARLSSVREQRVQDIQDKLRELQWTIGLWSGDREHDFLWLPEVRKFEPLTPAEWVKIRPGLVNWARNARKNEIRNLCVSTFTNVSIGLQRINNASWKLQPRGIDIAMLPVVQSIMGSEDLESDVPLHTISDILEKKFLRVLPPAIKKWSSDTVEELEQFAREQLSLPPQSKPSCLPSVIFRCKRCSRSAKRRSRFTFDEALSHDHLYRDRRSKPAEKQEMTPHEKLLMKFWTYPRNIQVLEVDRAVSQRVENLIKRMGQNPSSAMCDTLCRSTIKVVCGLCNLENAVKMNFKRALEHCLDAHMREEETEIWTRASGRTQDVA